MAEAVNKTSKSIHAVMLGMELRPPPKLTLTTSRTAAAGNAIRIKRRGLGYLG